MPWSDPLAELVRAGVQVARGRVDAALLRIAQGARALDAAGMGLHAAAARRWHGALVGGDEGRREVEAADAWMRGQQIKDPRRTTTMLLPLAARLA
jgi:hypothetical protein